MPCQVAIDFATEAVQADVNHEVAKAIGLYTKAAEALEHAAKSSAGERGEMLAKAAEYRGRVTVLQQKAHMEKMAAMASGRALRGFSHMDPDCVVNKSK
jgi:hypothetical protein